MQVRHSHIQIIIPLNHGMIFLPSEDRGLVRVIMIHSSKSVEIVGLEWMKCFLDSITWFFFLDMLT
jgi:hypothetical protein